MSEYTIGQVAIAARLAPSAIRYYEKLGLLPRPARRSGQRRYGRDVFTRLTVIQLCKQLGFELTEIKTVLDGMTKGDRSTKRVKQLAAEKLPQVEQTIAQAQLVRDLLLQASECTCPTLDECASGAERAGLVAFAPSPP